MQKDLNKRIAVRLGLSAAMVCAAMLSTSVFLGGTWSPPVQAAPADKTEVVGKTEAVAKTEVVVEKKVTPERTKRSSSASGRRPDAKDRAYWS